MSGSIYRVYLRHQEQRVSDKTNTTDRYVADHALRRLVVEHVGEHAAAVSSMDNKQKQYVRLDSNFHTCERCDYLGPFVDDGETCPRCALAQ